MICSDFSRTLAGNAPLVGTLVASTGILVLLWLLAQATARSRWVSRLLEGTAQDLVLDGRIVERQRTQHGVSSADPDEALRKQGTAEAVEARRVTIDFGGTLTVLMRR